MFFLLNWKKKWIIFCCCKVRAFGLQCVCVPTFDIIYFVRFGLKSVSNQDGNVHGRTFVEGKKRELIWKHTAFGVIRKNVWSVCALLCLVSVVVCISSLFLAIEWKWKVVICTAYFNSTSNNNITTAPATSSSSDSSKKIENYKSLIKSNFDDGKKYIVIETAGLSHTDFGLMAFECCTFAVNCVDLLPLVSSSSLRDDNEIVHSNLFFGMPYSLSKYRSIYK